MQEVNPLPHSLRDLAYIAVTAFLTLAATLLPKLLRPRQSKAEEAKVKAEARLIDLNAAIVSSDQMIKLVEKIAAATANVERLKAQKEFWQGRAEAESARADLAEAQLDRSIRIGGGNGKD